ncbi:MAG: phosphodiester glycosidase family protein [Rhizomicrobium sp.]
MRGWIGIIAIATLAAARAESVDPPCRAQAFEGSRFTVCRFDSRHQEMRLAWRGRDGKALRTFGKLADHLGRDAVRLRFAMNAGMYEADGSPLGLYVENGRERRPLNTGDADGNFYLKPNGVFSLDGDGTLGIETAEAFAARRSLPRFATQSGPMLVIGGTRHPKIAPDGPSTNIRNGVGVVDAHTTLFVISDDPVSFGRLARFFRDRLKCRDALYLDGAISSLWVPAEGRRTGGTNMGPIIAVLDKP